MCQVLLYLQINIDQKMLEFRDVRRGLVEIVFQGAQSFRDARPVLGLNIIGQPAGIFRGLLIPAFRRQPPRIPPL